MPRKKRWSNKGKDRRTEKEDGNQILKKAGFSFDECTDKPNKIEIKRSEKLGRYLVADRFLNAGDVVLVDSAIVVGPCQESRPLCIGCYVDIDLKNPKSFRRCVDCGWPLCSDSCSGWHQKYGHSPEECRCLSQSHIGRECVEAFQRFYYAITPFRCLLLKENNPEKWKTVTAMESHTGERKKDLTLWKTNQELAVDVIRNIWGLTQFMEDDIHFVCGILEINAFEINTLDSTSTQCLRAIYPTAFLFAHNCIPNACHSNSKQFDMIFRTITAIPPGEIINISYTYTLQSSLKRRQHLRKTKFFICECRRCSDPTELGSYTNGMKCQKCESGILLPLNPLCDESQWVCNGRKCKATIEVTEVISILDKYHTKLNSINGNDVDGYERFLFECRDTFHENHYICLSAMHCLSQIYGKIDGYLINNLTEQQLERKVEICRNLIRSFEKLEPGMSKERGILLYELHAPLMVLLRRKYESGNSTPKEINMKINQVVKYLKESILILSTEPEHTKERQMVEAARKALVGLKS